MAKASNAREARRFTDIPNVGPATAGDLARLGLHSPAELTQCDAEALYRQLCDITGVRHDPCVIDVFRSAIAFMNGEAARPWWHYTAARKSASPKG